MKERTIKQFNKLMDQHGLKLIEQHKYHRTPRYELYLNGEPVYIPNLHDMEIVTHEDLGDLKL
jgi:hypothetical protein